MAKLAPYAGSFSIDGPAESNVSLVIWNDDGTRFPAIPFDDIASAGKHANCVIAELANKKPRGWRVTLSYTCQETIAI